MRILLVHDAIIPAKTYGGIERVIVCLGRELIKLGHKVIFLVKKGSTSDFGEIIAIDNKLSIAEQIPSNIDIVHLPGELPELESLKVPYLITMHGNINDQRQLDKNTVFVSKNHAERFQSDQFIYNGLDWDEYSKYRIHVQRKDFHFLAKAAWKVKNIHGAIDLIHQTRMENLNVLGGVRFNFNMGIRFTFSPRVKFYGMIGGEQKDKLLNESKGLIFPVRWHEPFGLAIIESLYFGCPVFGTTYGSLPELVSPEVGFLSNSIPELLANLNNNYNPSLCHSYARDNFNSKRMAVQYLEKYERILSGENLNSISPQLKEIQKTKYLEWKK